MFFSRFILSFEIKKNKHENTIEFSLKPLTVVGVLFFLSFIVPVNVLYLTLDKTKSCVCVCVCRMPELNWQCWDFIFRGKKKIQKTAVRELTADIECILCVSVRMCVSVYNVNMPKARKTGKRESNRMSKFTALSLSSSSSFFFSTSSHSQTLLYDFLLVFVFCFQFE